MEIRPIKPKRPIINVGRVHRALGQEMYRFVTNLAKKFGTYPPPRPTVTGYRRTGALGRSWLSSLKSRPGLIVGRVGSDPTVMTGTPHHRRLRSGRLSKAWLPKRGYAPYVMGKKQSAEMKSRGWKKVGDILKGEWPGQVRRFQQVMNRNK